MILAPQTRACPVCHTEFIVQAGKGRPRIFDTPKCRDIDRSIKHEKRRRIQTLLNRRKRYRIILSHLEKELTTLLLD